MHRADAFVADGHPEFIDPVFGTPQPGGTRQQGGVGARVPDGEVLRPQRAAG